MTSSELVRFSLTNFVYLLTCHLLFQAIPLSLLLGSNIDDGQEPSVNVSLVRLDIKQELMFLLAYPATGQAVWT